MKIKIEKNQIWTPCGPPLPSISLLLVRWLRSYWNFHTICKIEKETLFVPENFSIQDLVFYIYTNIYIYIKEYNFLSFNARMKKKTILESLKNFLQNVHYIFSIFFFFDFYWKRKKTQVE